MICKNISRNQLIEEVAKRCDYYKEDVQVMYDALTATIIDHLMEADEQCNISINLCTGIMLKSNYVEGREHITDSSGRKLNIKKATYLDGKLIVDGKPVDLNDLLGQYFDENIFDIAISTKADNKYSPDDEIDVTELQ